jgi:methylthioribose-1-phosphate isomerase
MFPETTNVVSVRWSGDGSGVTIVDQRLLPGEYVERDLRTVADIVDAIRSLAVRGAPAIGVTAAMGLAHLAGAAAAEGLNAPAFRARISEYGLALKGARPTAVNLAWAVDRVLRASGANEDPETAARAMRREADTILAEDRAMCRRIGELGASLIEDGMTVLTHCNTGALATAGIGTALAAVYVAHESGKRIQVVASETRPLLQGSRLTAWELQRAGIPVSVVGEGAVASLMQAGRVDCCIVGADRITRYGDVANKIGTYSHAVVARAHGVPFYVAAPFSTIDAATERGSQVHIEQRSPAEVLSAAGHLAPSAVAALNPAFDVTPASLVAAIITDRGIFRQPYDFGGASPAGPASPIL